MNPSLLAAMTAPCHQPGHVERNWWVGKCFGGRAIFWTHRLCCWRKCVCFKLGFYPSPLLSGKERQHFSEKLRLRLESEALAFHFSVQWKCEMQAIICLPSLWCREAFISYCLISILLIIFQLATKLLEQETCHSVSGDGGCPFPGSDDAIPFSVLPVPGNAILFFLAIYYPEATLSSVLKILRKMSIFEAENI